MPDKDQPAWFDEDYYASQKVEQHNAMYPDDPWTDVAQYNRALASFGATNWQNWKTEYGNADNVSPNRFFNEAYYFTALAESSNKAETDGQTDWTPTKIKDYLTKTYHASGWDHYTAQGQYEGLNPSREFDTNAYFETRVEMLNAYDKGNGWQGKNDWAVDDYKQVMRDYGINPVMDLFISTDYGKEGATMTVTPVSNPLNPPAGWIPWTAVGPAWKAEEVVELSDKTETLAGKDGVPTLFKAVVAAGEENTLNPNDQIHGGANAENHLEIQLKGDFLPGFAGLATSANVTNIQQVDLINGGGEYDFSARNISGVGVWNLDNKSGSTDLTGLTGPGVTVNIRDQAEGRAAIIFDEAVVTGDNDYLYLGLSGVGKGGEEELTPVALSSPNVERLVMTSNGSAQNVVDITALNSLQGMAITGTADLAITAVDQELLSIDGSAATGNLNLLVSGANAMRAIVAGSGDDVITTSHLANNASLDGGYGSDQLTLLDAPGQDYTGLTIKNVETLTVNHNTGALTFDANNISGLQTLNIFDALAPVTVLRALWQNLKVNIHSDYAGITGDGAARPTGDDITLNGVVNLNLSLGDGDSATLDNYNGDFTAYGARAVVMNLEEGGNYIGSLLARDAITLSTNIGEGAMLELNGNPDATASNLANVGTLNLSGSGTADFHLANLGADATSITVNGSGGTGNFAASFSGARAVANQTLVANCGSGNNILAVSDEYRDIHITSGAGNDVVDLSDFGNFAGVQLYINLGGGSNTIYVDAAAIGEVQAMVGKQIFGEVDIVAGNIGDQGWVFGE